MSNATIKLDGIVIGNIPLEKVSKITAQLYKECFMESLSINLKDILSSIYEDMLKRVRVHGQRKEGIHLIDAYKKAMDSSFFGGNIISIMSTEIMDSLLKMKDTNDGWWRVLEKENDIQVVKNKRFVPNKRGIYGEGFLISTDDSSKFHRYSIADKRYITKFKDELEYNSLLNRQFMNNVVKMACSIMIFRLNRGE